MQRGSRSVEHSQPVGQKKEYREVQLDSTPEIEVFHMLFERCHTNNRKRYLKHHLNYFNFRSKAQLDQPVHRASLLDSHPV